MNLLIKKMCLIYLFFSFTFCGCGYSDEEKQKELILQIETADVEKTENTTDVSTDFTKESDIKTVQNEVYVYVCGAVKNEGVYRLVENSRVFEAIEMAGGFTEDADRTTLNLAREVTDGEQINVLTKEQAEDVLKKIESSGVVNINTATVSELTSISGIGESRAKAIIDYREKNGNFKSIDDIKKIDGIKEGLFSKIKDKITI